MTLHKGGSVSTHDTTSEIGFSVAVVIHKRRCHNTLRANKHWVSTKLKVIEPAIAITRFFLLTLVTGVCLVTNCI